MTVLYTYVESEKVGFDSVITRFTPAFSNYLKSLESGSRRRYHIWEDCRAKVNSSYEHTIEFDSEEKLLIFLLRYS